MAFSVTKCDVGGSTANGYHYEYLCESADDIANLPTGADSTEISKPAPGSLALLEDGTVYILKNNREWSEFSMAGGGGGGSTGGGVFIVTATEDGDTGALTLDKTCREIISALNAKTPTFIQMAWGNGWGETPALYDSLYLIPLNGVEYTDVDVQSGASTGVARYLFYALCASLNEPGTTVYLFSAASTEDYPVVAD